MGIDAELGWYADFGRGADGFGFDDFLNGIE
jgi:hypothetical protein